MNRIVVLSSATGPLGPLAAPLLLFKHGKDITIPKDTEITAYVNGDIPLDLNRFVTQSGKPRLISPEK